jgi:hypothetical protein
MNDTEELRTHIFSQELLDEREGIVQSLIKLKKRLDELVKKISDADLDMRKAKQSEDGTISINYYLIKKICLLNIRRWLIEATTHEEEEGRLLRELKEIDSQMIWKLLSHLNSKEIPQLENKSVPKLSVIKD